MNVAKSPAFPLSRTRKTASFHAITACKLWALALLALAETLVQPARAANVTEAWVRRYSNVTSNANDQAFKVVCDAAGDIVVTGTSDDGAGLPGMLTIKYSGTDGSLIWVAKRPLAGGSAMAVDGSGNVVVVGAYIAKYAAADGALLWEKSSTGGSYVAVDRSGNVVVAGSSDNGTNSDYQAAKYAAADGALLWEKRYNGPANGYDVARAVAVDGSGNVVVTGWSQNTNVLFNSVDYYTAKYAAASGSLLWERRYNPYSGFGIHEATALAVDGSGNVVVTGHSGAGRRDDYYTAKYAAANGALLWEKRSENANLEGYSSDQPTAVAVDGGGNVMVTGNSAGDYYTVKYAAASGAQLWERRSTVGGAAAAVAVDKSGNVVVTGYAGNTNGEPDYYTAKYAASNGALLWQKRYNGPANGTDQAQSVALDGSGNVVVTGSSGTVFFGDYFTAKYAASNGTLLWEKRYDGPTNRKDQAAAVAVDGSGNVVVTGSSYNGANDDYYTAKYAWANGALLWEKRFDGQDHRNDTATAMALDSSGNVVVTGCSDDGSTNYNYTAEYAAANGALLWEKRSTGGGTAVAVDGSGNAVVTGYSYNGTDRDYYTAKYAAADGALLWEQRYNGPARGSDSAAAIAVDGSGNVVVTGYSDDGSTNYNYTAKYAAANGALLWEKRSTVGGTAVAVDAIGNVVLTGPYPDYYTAKYAAANGALLWEKRGPDGGVGGAYAYGLVVDDSDNVVVTGYAFNGSENQYTAKYAAANGALLWEKRTALSGDGMVAVDGRGNVVVTGPSHNGSNLDFYTAKYAAADGTLLWETRYDGPGHGDDYTCKVALGSNGMVAVAGTSGVNLVSGATAFDYATVVYRESLPPLSIAPDGTGGYFIRGSGSAGSIYQLQLATSVTGPWMSNATITAASPGLIEFHDTNAPTGQAFYRTMQP